MVIVRPIRMGFVWDFSHPFHPFVPFQLHHAIVVLIEKKVLPITIVFEARIKHPTPGTSTRGIVVVVLRTFGKNDSAERKWQKFLGQKQMDKIPPEHLPITYRARTKQLQSADTYSLHNHLYTL